MTSYQASRSRDEHDRFISQVAASEIVWGIVRSECYAVCDANADVIMFWSDRDSAIHVQQERFSDCVLLELKLFEFLFLELPRIRGDGRLAGTNFNSDLAGSEIGALALQQQLLSAVDPQVANGYRDQLMAFAETSLDPNILFSLYQHPGIGGDAGPLRNLSNVDWSAAIHGHGQAYDLPSLLRALTSADSRHRRFACELLFQTIWHQGDVYDATSLAVPFLYNLLEADGPQDKSSIAQLLGTVADGQPTTYPNGKQFMSELRRQLARRLDLLLPYLRDPARGVRLSVVAAVGSFPEVAARVLPALEAALEDESDEHVRNALHEVIARRLKH